MADIYDIEFKLKQKLQKFVAEIFYDFICILSSDKKQYPYLINSIAL